jgi:hypothetical protein
VRLPNEKISLSGKNKSILPREKGLDRYTTFSRETEQQIVEHFQTQEKRFHGLCFYSTEMQTDEWCVHNRLFNAKLYCSHITYNYNLS